MHGVTAEVSAAAHRPEPSTAGGPSYDLVLVNPPFGARTDLLDPSSRDAKVDWPFGDPPVHSNDYAWLQSAVSAVSPVGRAAVVMPPRAAWSTHPNARAIREGLINAGTVRCVIGLPGGLFRQTTIAVSVWILGPPQNGEGENGEILLIDATAAGQLHEPTHRILTDADCDALVSMYHSKVRGEGHFPRVAGGITAITVTPTELRRYDFDLTPSRYTGLKSSTRPVAPGLPALRDELAELEAKARDADHALAEYLERLRPWTR